MNKNLKKKMFAQKERILDKLSKTEPGTKEYRDLQNQLGAFEIIEEKNSCGDIKAADWLKFAGTMVSTGLLVTADQWFPAVASKIKLSEFIKKTIH